MSTIAERMIKLRGKLPTEFVARDVTPHFPDRTSSAVARALVNMARQDQLDCVGTRVVEIQSGFTKMRKVMHVYTWPKTLPVTVNWRGPTGVTPQRGADCLGAALAVWPGSPAPAPKVYV